METCRLCLRYTETVMRIPNEKLKILQQLLSRLDPCVIKNPVLCEICVDDIEVVTKLIKNVNENDEKISQTLKNSEKQDQTIQCRICLAHIKCPKIFLCENPTNILRFDLLRNMLAFCNVMLNLEILDKPVMCLTCWEFLQISYSLKKTYIETNRKINLFCNIFKMKIGELKEETFNEIYKYFENDGPQQSEEKSLEKQYFKVEDDIKQEIKQELTVSDFNNPRRMKKTKFNEEDDRLLIKQYFHVTKLEKDFKFGYWLKIAKIWCELRPDKLLTSKTIRSRIVAVLNQSYRNILSKAEIHQIKEEVRKKLEMVEKSELIGSEEVNTKPNVRNGRCNRLKTSRDTFLKNLDLSDESRQSILLQHQSQIPPAVVPELPQNTTAIQNESDSDDSFVDEAAPSSFTPQIKCEPCDTEIVEAPELSLLQPKLEIESDNELEIPQLERMDIPLMDIKIAECYSVDEKREELNMYTSNPDFYVEDLKTCRRISFKNESGDGMFKCMQCSFETKYKFCANRHSRWHEKSRGKKKIYYCEHCSYRITNKILMLEHQKMHDVYKLQDDDIPMLYPFTHHSRSLK